MSTSGPLLPSSILARSLGPRGGTGGLTSVGELLRGRVAKRAGFSARAAAEKSRELERLRELPPGPRLQSWQLQSVRTHAVEADLDEVLPDGWYLAHEAEFDQLARRHELPGRALAMLVLLVPVHGLKGNPYGTGCALQASAAWWARKLGCTERHVHRLFNLLDPMAAWRRAERKRRAHRRGETRAQHDARMRKSRPAPKPEGRIYLHHFQQLRRYERVASNGFRYWLDTAGKAHSFVDVRPVTYLAPAGARLVEGFGWTRRRITVKAHGPQLHTVRCGAVQDVLRRWRPKDFTTRRRVAAVPTEVTPSNVRPVESSYTGRMIRAFQPGADAPGVWGATGPPAGDASPGDWQPSTGPHEHGPQALHVQGAGQGKPPTLAELVAAGLARQPRGRKL